MVDAYFMHLSLFDLAYELGQYCLDVADFYSKVYSDTQLVNAFVAQFLLPADEFTSTCKDFIEDGLLNLTEVVAYFDLSTKIIRLRLMELNII